MQRMQRMQRVPRLEVRDGRNEPGEMLLLQPLGKLPAKRPGSFTTGVSRAALTKQSRGGADIECGCSSPRSLRLRVEAVAFAWRRRQSDRMLVSGSTRIARTRREQACRRGDREHRGHHGDVGPRIERTDAVERARENSTAGHRAGETEHHTDGAGVKPCRMTSSITSRGDAPRAIRTPSSRERVETMYDNTP